jgi:hypothetical protein
MNSSKVFYSRFLFSIICSSLGGAAIAFYLSTSGIPFEIEKVGTSLLMYPTNGETLGNPILNINVCVAYLIGLLFTAPWFFFWWYLSETLFVSKKEEYANVLDSVFY